MTEEPDITFINIVTFYDYKCQDIDEWLLDFDTETTKANWSDSQRYQCLHFFLGATAEDWYMDQLEKPDFPKSWLELREMVHKHFDRTTVTTVELRLPDSESVLRQLIIEMQRIGSDKMAIIAFLNDLEFKIRTTVEKMLVEISNSINSDDKKEE